MFFKKIAGFYIFMLFVVIIFDILIYLITQSNVFQWKFFITLGDTVHVSPNLSLKNKFVIIEAYYLEIAG